MVFQQGSFLFNTLISGWEHKLKVFGICNHFVIIEPIYCYISIHFQTLWDNTSTAKNTVIPPSFLVWKFCGKVQFLHCKAQLMRKLCLSTKFPHQEIRWNYGIFHSVPYLYKVVSSVKLQTSVSFLKRSKSFMKYALEKSINKVPTIVSPLPRLLFYIWSKFMSAYWVLHFFLKPHIRGERILVK